MLPLDASIGRLRHRARCQKQSHQTLWLPLLVVAVVAYGNHRASTLAGKTLGGLARTSRGASAVLEKATSMTTTAVAVVVAVAVAVAFESFVVG